MKQLSERKARLIIAGLSALAAIRVFVFAAAFPFFNNVDEQAHVDLVVRYAHGNPPHSIEPFSAEAALYFAVYSTPEYFVPPSEYGGQYPPPTWLLPHDELTKVLNDEVAAWQSRPNHEAGEPPLYYAIAGAWFNLGRICGFRGLSLLYWVRFLNVAVAIALVWVGYKIARIVFPQEPLPAIATATLLAIWPQTSFYSIQGDSLSPVAYGIAFMAFAKLLQSERPKILLGVWIGLSVAATCLIKTANLPLLFLLAIGMLFKAAQLARDGKLPQGLGIFGAFVISSALPIGIWFARNHRYFGDLTATKSKIELLGWTAKPFSDWWSHPIFTPLGAKDFWAELLASFWRGEFIWHHERLATLWSDAFYWIATTIALVITMASLVARRRSEPNSGLVWFAFLSFASLIGFLVLLSIRFDFDDCPYPSRAHPYFTSGRLLNAAVIPFFLLFAYAIERVASWMKREWVRWVLLAIIALLVLTWQLSINEPVLASRYNFFHRPAIQ